jgi:Heavy-metal resistance protein CzcE
MKAAVSSPVILSLALSLAALAGCATRNDPIDLYGYPQPPDAYGRTIVIAPDTRYVNVTGGETVRFVAGDKIFAWNFFVARTVSNFDLNAVAPPGVLDHPVRVYVAPDPRYLGAGGLAHGHGRR